MAALGNAKLNHFVGSAGKHIVEVVYDFAVDGGAVGTLDVFEAKEGMIVTDVVTQVLTTCTSGGSATLILGVVGGDVDAFLASTAVASLTANATFPQAAAGVDLYLAANGKVGMAIGTAALTAGKIKFYIEVMQAA
jgi:hypothetical protein